MNYRRDSTLAHSSAMFHAVPAHLQPQLRPTHAAATASQQQQQQQYLQPTITVNATTSDAALFQGIPTTTITNDGRPVVYFMPSTSAGSPGMTPTTTPQSSPLTNGSHVLSTVTAVPSGKTDYPTVTRVCPTAFPTTSSNNNNKNAWQLHQPQQQQQLTPPLVSDLLRSPPAPSEGPPPYVAAADKSVATAASFSVASSSLPACSLPRAAGTSVAGTSTTTTAAFDASSTSNGSGSVLVGRFAQPSAPPTPSQPQACFWVNSTTGAIKAMTADEVAVAMSASRGAALPAYAVTPLPLPPASFSSSIAPVLATALPGAVPYIPIVAVPSTPPPAPKTMNGIQYEHGELYEGFVKRYNPNRGFGFLTATHHIKPDGVAARSSASTTSAPNGNHNLSSASAPASAQECRVPVHLGDIFVHQSYMHMQGFRTLPVGGRVRFRVGYKDGQQTFQAVDVELLPQVVPQSMEASTPSSPPIDRVSDSASATDGSPSQQQQHLTVTATDFEKARPVGSPVSPDCHTEAERFFFSAPKDKGLGRSFVTLTQGESLDDNDEDGSPLIELAYEVYTSLEE